MATRSGPSVAQAPCVIVRTCPPVELSTCTRLFPVSATAILAPGPPAPAPAPPPAATPSGRSNSPSPAPCRPTAEARPDMASIISSLLLPVSAAAILPSGSAATPFGPSSDRTPSPAAPVPL